MTISEDKPVPDASFASFTSSEGSLSGRGLASNLSRKSCKSNLSQLAESNQGTSNNWSSSPSPSGPTSSKADSECWGFFADL
eukprot:CAMPEP_0116838004 /NCGR_PEP_ID=MMETSP0418-20121206/8970_1 /TAXON_ID=1158023 /ORGANISM="Astrosyne radiata, Strain 13vi08-1A" /LENGTH=81 /DNA_ID=CAMNT_0004467955 /DNA_START=407 /DNA_END=652 /DNA_ORIENTATION=-